MSDVSVSFDGEMAAIRDKLDGLTGYIQGWLAGTSGTDPDLYLERWNGSAWIRVAGSASVTPQERVVYRGSAGFYRFRVFAFSGGGTFDIFVNRPA